jgi:hypothetical protein
MLWRASLLLTMLTIALAAGDADAAAKGSKRAYRPPPPAAELGLRGPADALKPALGLAAPQSFATPLPIPGRALTGLTSGGLTSGGLTSGGSGSTAAFTPLRSIGDQAPICRTSCAEARVVCASTDDQNCDSAWAQCVADCSAPVLR